jgi:hypothetical protein
LFPIIFFSLLVQHKNRLALDKSFLAIPKSMHPGFAQWPLNFWIFVPSFLNTTGFLPNRLPFSDFNVPDPRGTTSDFPICRGRSPLPAILRLNFFLSKIVPHKIKDSIPLDADGVNCRNQIFNFVEGQFLTKRNSNAKWREGGFGRVFYGSENGAIIPFSSDPGAFSNDLYRCRPTACPKPQSSAMTVARAGGADPSCIEQPRTSGEDDGDDDRTGDT